MRILITGATGFVGGHLIEALAASGASAIHGLNRSGQWGSEISHLAAHATLHAVDLHDGMALRSLMEAVQPTTIFHLAGYANTGKSFKEPDLCWRDNLDATRKLYDSIVALGLKPRIVFASTGLIYGEAEDAAPVTESATLKPASPYAASKAAADLLSYQVYRTHALPIVRVRLFNQFGPRQPSDYALANFARQIAAIEAGEMPPVLETGDLRAQRDLTDVRDMVRAILLLAEHGQPGEAYNAGSGQTVVIGDALARMVSLAEGKVEVRSRIDERAGDTAVTRASIKKLVEATGWTPQRSFDDSLRDVLNHWRARK